MNSGNGGCGPTDPQYWSAQIGYGITLRARAVELLPDEHPILVAPHVGATPDVLAGTAVSIGRELDLQHRMFLSQADGWPDFFMSGDLLSTDQLVRSPELDGARITLEALYDHLGPGPDDLPIRDSLTVILASLDNSDIVVIDHSGPVTAGGHPVHWLGDEIVDSFANFDEFFRSANQYLRDDVDRAGGIPDGYRPTL